MKRLRKTSSRDVHAGQSDALAPWLKEVEALVLELVPDAPRSLVRRRTALLDRWLQHALGTAIEPRPLSPYDGVLLVAGPLSAKKRLARSFRHLRNTYLDMLEDAAPLMDSVQGLDAIAEARNF